MSWIVEIACVSLAAAAALAARRYWKRCAERGRAGEDDRALRLMSAMSVSIADGVRNPLSSLKGHAQLLGQMQGSPEMRERVERIVRETVRVEKVVHDLLDLWKLKSWNPHRCDPARLLRSWARTLESDPIMLDVEQAPSTWMMDPDRLFVVLDLLLRTVRSRCLRGTRVALSVREDGGFLVLLIGAIDVVAIDAGVSARAPSPSLAKSATFASHYAIADLVARQHRGSISVAESTDGALLFRLALGRL